MKSKFHSLTCSGEKIIEQLWYRTKPRQRVLLNHFFDSFPTQILQKQTETKQKYYRIVAYRTRHIRWQRRLRWELRRACTWESSRICCWRPSIRDPPAVAGVDRRRGPRRRWAAPWEGWRRRRSWGAGDCASLAMRWDEAGELSTTFSRFSVVVLCDLRRKRFGVEVGFCVERQRERERE